MGVRHFPAPRRTARVRVVGRAIVHGDDGVSACDVLDLSLGGLLLQRDACGGALPAVGEPVTVELHLASRGSRWHDLSAHVCRRAAADRIAVTLDRTPPDLEDEIEEEVLAAVEAASAPRVVVVDPPGPRRRHLADTVRRAACVPVVASTPLEALQRLGDSRTHAVAMIVGEDLTQTHGEELAHYVTTTHPDVRVALIHDPARPAPVVDPTVMMLEPGDCDRIARVYDLLGR